MSRRIKRKIQRYANGIESLDSPSEITVGDLRQFLADPGIPDDAVIVVYADRKGRMQGPAKLIACVSADTDSRNVLGYEKLLVIAANRSPCPSPGGHRKGGTQT